VNNIFVFCEIEENNVVADVSQELLTKGRVLANQLNCKLEAVVLGDKLTDVEKNILPYGVDILHIAEHGKLYPYLTLPFASIIVDLIKKVQPQVALFGATTIGRDLAPRVASALKCGLTADCTELVIGEHTENRTGKEYKDLLYQVRPAFGGNIIATIINPDTRPQMATVREGVMKKEIVNSQYQGEIHRINAEEIMRGEDFVARIIERHIEARKINIKAANIIIAGGYGVGSRDGFKLLYELGAAIGAEVGASRAAVDAGFVEHERQIGQTGITVRPKLYIACGISGQIQHRAGMMESSMIISINNDPHAPINSIADYTIIGDLSEVLPRMIKSFRKNSK
jgi:electron transfer flavoprotein alpha subunit